MIPSTHGKIFAYTLSLSKKGIPTVDNGYATSVTSGTALPVTTPATTYTSIATPGDAGSTSGPNL